MYNMIIKRKSFHLFRDNKTRTYFNESNHLTNEEVEDIYKILYDKLEFAKSKGVENIILDVKLTSVFFGINPTIASDSFLFCQNTVYHIFGKSDGIT